MLQRVLWTLAGLTLIQWAIQLLSASTTFPIVALLVVTDSAVGLALVCQSLVHDQRLVHVRALRVGTLPVVGLTLVSIAVWGIIQVHSAPGYGTDEIAFDQYAAQLALHGLDPYTHSLAQAFNLFHVSPDGFTFHLNGTPVTSLSYPALSFELYVPLLWLGWSTQLAVAVNLASWLLACALLFALLPRDFKALGLILSSFAVYVSYSLGGVTDTLYVPLLLVAAYRWVEFPTSKSWRRFVGPVCLGLAMAVKQTPWLVFPFVVLGIAIEARRSYSARSAARVVTQYVLVVLGSFLLPNIPYFAANPSAFLRGVLTPLDSTVVPAGQGLVALSLFLHVGGGSIRAFDVCAAFAVLILLAAYVRWYRLMRPLAFILPAVALFFAPRSFGSYFVSLLPALLVAALTCEYAQLVGAARRFRRRRDDSRRSLCPGRWWDWSARSFGRSPQHHRCRSRLTASEQPANSPRSSS